MNHAEAINLVQHHQSMLSTVDEYTPEYMEGLLDPNSPDYGVKLSQALEIVLKGVTQDGQGKDYPRAS
jgi:hypothetical protein